MPNKKSAIKELRKSAKRAIRNYKVKKAIKDVVKESKKLIETKEKQATDKVKAAIKLLDKAAAKKIIAKNTAARKKSRLMKKLNLISK
jgi:small subunit ribosomal protein S20